jgi:hypothetical protein
MFWFHCRNNPLRTATKMIFKSLAAIFLTTQVLLSTSQEVPPPAVPKSLDNYGGNVSDYSIMYTRNLEDVMDRFQISRAEMEKMLRSYVAGGLPTITKTVFNPDTNLNEVHTYNSLSMCSYVHTTWMLYRGIFNRTTN